MSENDKISKFNWPDISTLPIKMQIPESLELFDGRKVTNLNIWKQERKPELQSLFQHFMYGNLPKVTPIRWEVRRVDSQCLNGKATLKEICIYLGSADCPPLELMVVIPNLIVKPVPIFLGLNFTGNHSLLEDPKIKLPINWMRDKPFVINNRATEEGRGKNKDTWCIEQIIDAGFGIATFYYGDGLADKPDFTDGSYPYFGKNSSDEKEGNECGAIAYWAWTLQRAVDYLITNEDIDKNRIVAFGHSRNGKAALVAAAYDERIALAIPHQAGCGGTAPHRTTNPKAETVAIINERFPHWFCENFKKFGKQVELIPFDQNSLVALCAPRPVLFSCGLDDQWSDPAGQWDVLKHATPVYELYGDKGLVGEKPNVGELRSSTLGYYLREGVHIVDSDYWQKFIAFVKVNLKII